MKRRACVCDGEPPHSSSTCRSCYQADRRRRNPEVRKYLQKWRATGDNAERERLSRRPSIPRERTARLYGITLEEYAAFLAKPCGICGAPSKHLDHDHACCEKGKGCPNLEGWFAEHRDAALAWIAVGTTD